MTERHKTTVVNMRLKEFDEYIGRGRAGQRHMSNTTPGTNGWLGNPYSTGTRNENISKFERSFLKKLEGNEEFRLLVLALKGKTLGCFCKPARCHGDVIVAWLEGEYDE